MNDIKLALLGSKEAAKRLTDAGVLLGCPVCSKQPKILRDIGYETSGFGAWCTIQCKPMFRKAHRKVESGKSTWERAEYYARLAWNTRAPILSAEELQKLEETTRKRFLLYSSVNTKITKSLALSRLSLLEWSGF